MNGLRTHNSIRQASECISQRELAQRAARVDAIIATVSLIGLVVLLIIQIAEKAAA